MNKYYLHLLFCFVSVYQRPPVYRCYTIPGSVWVVGAWNVVHSENYVDCRDVIYNGTAVACQHCDTVVLTFGFATVIIEWILLGLVITFAVLGVFKIPSMMHH
jgi:hypothetical protein